MPRRAPIVIYCLQAMPGSPLRSPTAIPRGGCGSNGNAFTVAFAAAAGQVTRHRGENTMSIQAVLLPLFVQVALTFVLLFWTGYLRSNLLKTAAVKPQDIAL